MRGTRLLNGAVGWIGTGVLLLGLLVGIGLPTVFHLPVWAGVTLGAVLILGVLAEGSYRLWDEADKGSAPQPPHAAVVVEGDLHLHLGGQGGAPLGEVISPALPPLVASGQGVSGGAAGLSRFTSTPAGLILPAGVAVQPPTHQDEGREN